MKFCSQIRRRNRIDSYSSCWMRSIVSTFLGLGFAASGAVVLGQDLPEGHPLREAFSPETWRAEHRIADVHTHISGKAEYFKQAIGIMDLAGIGVAVELGSGTVTHKEGETSAFEKLKAIAQQVAPGRFVHHMLIDYSGWDDPSWSERAVAQIVEGKRLGASGVKEFKRLGLYLKDGQGKLIKIDDPKLDPVWAKCGELNMPVSIHVGDPKAFWEPLNDTNERWEELRDHPNWWFGDPAKYPPRMELLDALARVIGRHPKTTFVCVHFANNPEDLDWVDRQLSEHPNMMADIAARIPEIGRQPSDKLHALFVKHQDRFVFGSDFMVNTRYILGSAGDQERPTDQEAYTFFEKSWKFFETKDREWTHMTPIQGNWKISSIYLPPDVLRKVYFDNARRVLGQSWPKPVMRIRKIANDFAPDGVLQEAAWKTAMPARIEYGLRDAKAHPNLSTKVRGLWSDQYLYLAYEAPYTELLQPKTQGTGERLGLWDGDVVEAFIGSDPDQIKDYTEYEWAPNGEQLDLKLSLPEKDFEWSSKMESKVRLDTENKVWITEVRIPLKSLSDREPKVGSRWKLNLYRHDTAHRVFMAWNPTGTGSAHTPSEFGWLEFSE